MALQIDIFPCRSDNYGALLHDPQAGLTAAIDAPEAAAVEKALRARGLKLTHILTTHHHGDHVEGNLALKEKWGCKIIGPAGEAAKIPGIDETVSGGQSFTWAGREVKVLACPGHTKGHIAFYMPTASAVFAGDTLFSVGCGRVLEGTMDEMFHSVSQFKTLPPETALYCGHEYTLANCTFALTVDPANGALQARAKEAESLRQAGKLTCPVPLASEFKTNPYLRLADPAIRKMLGLESATDLEVFSEIRTRKNNFK